MIRINLLPSAHKRKKSGNTTALLIGGLVVTLVLVGGGLFAWQSMTIAKLEQHKADLTKVLSDYASQKAKIDEIRRNLATLQSRLAVKAEILKGGLDIPKAIEEIAAFIPKDVKIDSANLGNGTFTFTITTTSYSSAANALIALETAPSFQNVETSAVSKSGTVTFTITGQLAPQGGASDGSSANY